MSTRGGPLETTEGERTSSLASGRTFTLATAIGARVLTLGLLVGNLILIADVRGYLNGVRIVGDSPEELKDLNHGCNETTTITNNYFASDNEHSSDRSIWDFPSDCYQPLCLPPDFPGLDDPDRPITWTWINSPLGNYATGSYADYQLLDNVAIYKMGAIADYTPFMHAHHMFHAGVLLAGSKKIVTLDEEPHLVLTAGKSFGIPKDVFHADVFLEDNSVVYLRFDGPSDTYMPAPASMEYMIEIDSSGWGH